MYNGRKHHFPFHTGAHNRRLQEAFHGKSFAHPHPPPHRTSPCTRQGTKSQVYGKFSARRFFLGGSLSAGLLFPALGSSSPWTRAIGSCLLLHMVHTDGAVLFRRLPSRNTGGVVLGGSLPPLHHPAAGDPLLRGSPLPSRRPSLRRTNLSSLVLAIHEDQPGISPRHPLGRGHDDGLLQRKRRFLPIRRPTHVSGQACVSPCRHASSPLCRASLPADDHGRRLRSHGRSECGSDERFPRP